MGAGTGSQIARIASQIPSLGFGTNMALVLEDIGWGTVEHWMRMQAGYELAQVRCDRTALAQRIGALPV